MDSHSLKSDAVISELATNSQKGLSEPEAASRFLRNGPNELKAAPKPPAWQLFLDQFKDFLVLILIVAAGISALLGETIDAGVILLIVILNAAFGFVQQQQAEKALEALKKMVALKARVVREGVERSLEARELVVGDVIVLEAGDQVPADCRLLEAMSLEVAESSLTGESQPVSKDAEVVLNPSTPVADRENMVFMGTVVTRGRGRAVVASTGMATQFGSIAHDVQSIVDEETPLQKKLDDVGRKLGQGALAIVAVIFVLGILRGFPAFDMFLVSVSLAVAAVPEGLPAIMTATLAVGVQRMAKRNAVIRKLRAVETLGSADVICTDKTGTLTRNEMTVRKLLVGVSREVDVTGTGYAPEGDFVESSGKAVVLRDAELKHLLRAAAFCTTASLRETRNGHAVLGDPTEGALLAAAAKAGVSKDDFSYKRLYDLPFETERKAMSAIYSWEGKRVAFVKGAPEAIVEKSTRVAVGEKDVAFSPGDRKKVLDMNAAFASKAMRVLGVAYRVLPPDQRGYSPESVERDLVFLGLVGMIDPPREEAKQAIALCKTAGIRVVMITGDNPLTAKAIASELGISSEKVLSGSDLDSLSQSELEAAAKGVSIFARVSPEHKLKLVGALKAQGHVVAMTGDGVNDAPALKKADIGVSMGIAGTDVSKEASDMVLADDNFASIVNAVHEGRIIYDNIVKTIYFLLSCNIGEIMVIFFATLVAWPVPLVPVQILWMNLVTDGLPALALGMEPAEPGVMNRPPRRKDEEILGMGAVMYFLGIGTIIAVGTLAVYFFSLGGPLDRARTLAFTTIVLFQIFHSFNSRSLRHSLSHFGLFSNKLLWLAAVVAVGLQYVVVQFGAEFFNTVPLSLADWGLCFAVSGSIVVIVEIWKAANAGK